MLIQAFVMMAVHAVELGGSGGLIFGSHQCQGRLWQFFRRLQGFPYYHFGGPCNNILGSIFGVPFFWEITISFCISVGHLPWPQLLLQSRRACESMAKAKKGDLRSFLQALKS